MKLPPFKGCFGCGHLNPIGLRLERFWDRSEGVVYSDFVLSENYQGFDGVAHGGIISTIADELLWWVIAAQEKVCSLTAQMTVRYKRPVLCGVSYRGVAKVAERRGRKIRATCVIEREGEVHAEAEGLFVALPHEEWEKFLASLEDPSVLS